MHQLDGNIWLKWQNGWLIQLSVIQLIGEQSTNIQSLQDIQRRTIVNLILHERPHTFSRGGDTSPLAPPLSTSMIFCHLQYPRMTEIVLKISKGLSVNEITQIWKKNWTPLKMGRFLGRQCVSVRVSVFQSKQKYETIVLQKFWSGISSLFQIWFWVLVIGQFWNNKNLTK